MNPDVLQNKRDLTRLQILVEIAARQPNVRQKEVAERIGVTPQAVSEYIKELQRIGYVHTSGRVQYSVTKPGVEWIIQTTRELKRYTQYVLNDVISHVATGSAIAEEDLREGQRVHLYMRDGLLYAAPGDGEATATALEDARAGVDVAVGGLEGLIEMDSAMVTICRVPRVHRGGSRNTDIDELQEILDDNDGLLGAIGVEALVAIRKAGYEPDVFFGAREAAVEAAYHGLPSVIICVDEEVPQLLNRLESDEVEYQLIDLTQ